MFLVSQFARIDSLPGSCVPDRGITAKRSRNPGALGRFPKNTATDSLMKKKKPHLYARLIHCNSNTKISPADPNELIVLFDKGLSSGTDLIAVPKGSW